MARRHPRRREIVWAQRTGGVGQWVTRRTRTGPSTRSALHAVAEHVLAPALHVSTGHIGLRVMRGGFGTPVFRSPHGNRQVQVDGLDLVVTDDRGRRRAPLTTIAEAAAFVEVTPGAPKGLYPPSTTLELDRPLRPEPDDGGDAR